jgi:uncharacterized membrane-anchored protein
MPSPSDRQRNFAIGLIAILILGLVNIQILGKERIISNGSIVLLDLAPRDPRSLIQGDYMALRYSMAGPVAAAATAAEISDGYAVVQRNDRQVAQFVKLRNGHTLRPDEMWLRFRKRGGTVRLASDAYFFEEGQWETFSPARYGELRVDDDGNAVLTGLRDGDFRPLGPVLH